MSRRVHLAPGTYVVRNITAGTNADVVVPALTVAIAQASPSVGQTLTLTTNAAAGPAYQWRAGGVDINLATAATFNTTGRSAGDVITCRVVSGAQTVTSAGVTLAAAAGVAATYIGSAIQSVAPGTALVSPVSLTAGQKYVLVCSTRGSNAGGMTASVNGTDAEARIEALHLQDGGRNLTAMFDVTPAASGTQVIVTADVAIMRSVHIWSIPNAATYQRGAASAATNGQLVRDVSLTVNAGELVIAGGGTRSIDGLLTMVLAGVTQQGPNRHANALIAVGGDAGDVAAAAPRTVTLTRGGDSGAFTAVAGAWA